MPPATTFPSLTQQCLADGMNVHFDPSAAGRTLRTDTNETVSAQVEDWQPIDDPEFSARQKNQVFVVVTAAVGCVADPRLVRRFYRDHINYYKMLKFSETEGDLVTWRWICEAQRKT